MPKMPQSKTQRRVDFPTSEEFSQTLGQVTWLMGQSEGHKNLTISDLEARVHVPLILKQVRVFVKGKQPLAALTWASVSDEVLARVRAGSVDLGIKEWRSGSNLVVIDRISPFTDAKRFEEILLGSVKVSQPN